MHETVVAENLLAMVLAEAEKQNAKPIGVEMSCGAFEAINDEVLSFAFESIAKGTICEGVKLKIEHGAIKAKCNNCSQNFNVELDNPACSECGSDDFALLPDEPLVFDRIEFFFFPHQKTEILGLESCFLVPL